MGNKRTMRISGSFRFLFLLFFGILVLGMFCFICTKCNASSKKEKYATVGFEPDPIETNTLEELLNLQSSSSPGGYTKTCKVDDRNSYDGIVYNHTARWPVDYEFPFRDPMLNVTTKKLYTTLNSNPEEMEEVRYFQAY